MKSYRLRRMYASDLKWVFRARNHETIRSASGFSERISFRDHCNWFIRESNLIKLVFTEDSKPKGVITYDKEWFNWSFYLVPSKRKRSGLGLLMLSLFLVYAKEKRFKIIKGLVLPWNEISHKLHRRLGFKWTGMDYYKEL